MIYAGACVKRPNLCIVTEFVARGSMKDILQNTTIKLAWRQRLTMLRSAALGTPCILSLYIAISSPLICWYIRMMSLAVVLLVGRLTYLGCTILLAYGG